MKKIFISFLLFFAFSVSSWAQKDLFNPINTGVNSLNIAPDSRGGGMGDVGAATDPDNNSQYWNPAKYPFTIGRAGVSISYTPWLRKLLMILTWLIWPDIIVSVITRLSVVRYAISLWVKCLWEEMLQQVLPIISVLMKWQ